MRTRGSLLVLLPQIYTNATVAAGLVDDGRTLLTGLNDILGELLQQSLRGKPE
jgi:hypothetical protein